VQQKLDKLKGSLADYSDAIRLLMDRRNEFVHWQLQIVPRHIVLAEALAGRSWVYVRLGKTREALNDATQAVETAPSAGMLNARAYARAVLKVELKEGLADIDQALTQRHGEAEFLNTREAEFLDTRGYLLHQLGRDAEALSVMDRAIAQFEHADRNTLNQSEQAELDHSLAVMYHHRGEIYQTLGEKDKADIDIRRGENLGYDPAHGVF
jgi:tetratricopeptide (TPR) repeat protein